MKNFLLQVCRASLEATPRTSSVARRLGQGSSLRFVAALIFSLALIATSARADTVFYNFANTPDGAGAKGKLVADIYGNLYGTTAAGGANGFGSVFVLCAPFAPSPDIPPCTPGATSWGPETVLYSFQGPTTFMDGANPTSTMIFGNGTANGAFTLYATTLRGGYPNVCGGLGCGTVFELCAPMSSGGCSTNPTAWEEKVLWRFSGAHKDGSNPYAGVIADGANYLYGTTVSGGIGPCSNVNLYCGTVFKLTHNTNYTGWTEIVMHKFRGAFLDGANPYAALCCSSTTISTVYGTTVFGGLLPNNASGNAGVVFSVQNGFPYTETILHSFCTQTAGCPDGMNPFSNVIFDTSGNLYGTTAYGGSRGEGLTYELPGPLNNTETVLYTFCTAIGPNCPDGAVPIAGLKLDGAGNLYGTTNLGGANRFGEVFEFPFGSYTSAPSLLWSFTGGPSDGGNPYDGVISDPVVPSEPPNSLYGLTPYSGTGNFGVIYRVP